MQLNKNKQDKTKLNQITHKYQYNIILNIHIYTLYYIGYIVLTRISNVTSNPKLILFDRLPLVIILYCIQYINNTESF